MYILLYNIIVASKSIHKRGDLKLSEKKIQNLKMQTIELKDKINKIYLGILPAEQNIIQMTYKLTALNAELKRLQNECE